jgi:hypothetical protein
VRKRNGGVNDGVRDNSKGKKGRNDGVAEEGVQSQMAAVGEQPCRAQ